MLVPASHDLIRRIVLDPGFWDGYLDRPWNGENDDPPEFECDLLLLALHDRSLQLRVLQNPNLMTLFLSDHGTLLPELGYDDDCAQFLPWTLRWIELEYIARLTALRDQRVRHPGPYLALLSRFTPLTTTEEFLVARPMLARALTNLRGGPPIQELRSGPTLDERLAYQLDHWDFRGADDDPGYRWRPDTVGWSLVDADDESGWGPLTLRSGDNADFPFAEWATFVDKVVVAYNATVDVSWRTLPALRNIAHDGDQEHLGELAEQLINAGCEHPVILRALLDPIDPTETLWVLELLLAEQPGTRLRTVLAP